MTTAREQTMKNCLCWQRFLLRREQSVTWVWVEQIDREPPGALSRHTAFIIVRRQECFEASRGSSGQTEQASRHVTEHYRSCNSFTKRAGTVMKKRLLNREGVMSSRGLSEMMLCRHHSCFLRYNPCTTKYLKLCSLKLQHVTKVFERMCEENII